MRRWQSLVVVWTRRCFWRQRLTKGSFCPGVKTASSAVSFSGMPPNESVIFGGCSSPGHRWRRILWAVLLWWLYLAQAGICCRTRAGHACCAHGANFRVAFALRSRGGAPRRSVELLRDSSSGGFVLSCTTGIVVGFLQPILVGARGRPMLIGPAEHTVAPGRPGRHERTRIEFRQPLLSALRCHPNHQRPYRNATRKATL